MKDQCIVFSDQTKKIRSKYIIFSGVSLFVGLTETLPKKFSLLGLDLSENQEVLGWFIFYVTLILFLNFIVVTTIEIRGHYIPLFIQNQKIQTISDIEGLTDDEILDYYEPPTGKIASQFQSIERKNRRIVYNYKKMHVYTHNVAVFLFELISPVIFSFIGMYYLYSYLSCLK